jgi:hypothetical protein
MAAGGPNGRNLDPGIRLVLQELRDLRLEMRDDRRRADEERRQADEERRQATEERRRADEERRRADAERDARFEAMMREFREDSARREAATQKAFRDIRAVGLSIVKTLNHHTRLLERIDHKLGAWNTRRPGPGNGGGAAPRR